MQELPFLLIRGQTIQLRPMTVDDLAHKVRWYNDPNINSSLIIDEELRLDKTIEWFKSIAGTDRRYDLIIETLAGDVIGLIGLYEIDRKNKTAEIIIVIGNSEYWGKGVMFEAESLLIQWAFDTLGMEKIWALVRIENIASIVTMKKLGFKMEATLRQEKLIADKRLDIIRVGLLKEEFKPAEL